MRWFLPVLLIGCAFSDDDLDADGWTVGMGDCADLDPDVHPEAHDALADGVDQDCDGIDPLMRVHGQDHDCLLATTGEIVCDGANDQGQLEVPETPTAWVKVAAGDAHTCALDVDGRVRCWGANDHGQSDAPGGAFADIQAGSSWSLGVHLDGEAVCWGACLVSNRK